MTEATDKDRQLYGMDRLCLLYTSRKIKKRISRPIELLTEATHKFGNGEEGYDENNIVDLDMHTRDEIE